MVSRINLCAGIVVGARQVQLAIIENRTAGLCITNVKSLSYNGTLDKEAAVKQLFSELQLKEKLCYTVMSVPTVEIIKSSFLVPVEFKELDITAQIELNAQAQLLNKFNDLFIDYRVKAESKTEKKVLVYAINKDVVSRYLELSQKTPLNIACIEPELHALRRFARYLQQGKKEHFVLVDNDHDYLRIVVGDHQKTLLSRCLPLLSNDRLTEMKQSLGLLLGEANQLLEGTPIKSLYITGLPANKLSYQRAIELQLGLKNNLMNEHPLFLGRSAEIKDYALAIGLALRPFCGRY